MFTKNFDDYLKTRLSDEEIKRVQEEVDNEIKFPEVDNLPNRIDCFNIEEGMFLHGSMFGPPYMSTDNEVALFVFSNGAWRKLDENT